MAYRQSEWHRRDILPGLMRDAFENPRWSDLDIRSQDRVWNVHRMVVCPQCKFLEAAAEGQFKEARDGVIVLDDDDPNAVHAMLEFFYSSNYRCPDAGIERWRDGEAGCLSPSELAVMVHTIADKYQIEALRELATAKFMALLSTIDLSMALVHTIKAIYATGPDTKQELQDPVVEMVATRYRDYKAGRVFDGCKAVFDIPLFMAALLEREVLQREQSAYQSCNCRVRRTAFVQYSAGAFDNDSTDSMGAHLEGCPAFSRFAEDEEDEEDEEELYEGEE